MQEISKKRINWIPALVFQSIALALGIILDLLTLRGEKTAAGGWALFSLPILALAVAFWAIMHYECWKSLPERYRETTPGKAIGFMFIPFYSFYWAFTSIPGLAKGFYEYGRRNGIKEIDNKTGLGIAFAVVFVCYNTIGLIPGFTSILGVASFVLFILFYKDIVDYANRVLES